MIPWSGFSRIAWLTDKPVMGKSNSKAQQASEVTARLMRLFEAISDQISKDAQFAQRIRLALDGPVAPKPGHVTAKAPPDSKPAQHKPATAAPRAPAPPPAAPAPPKRARALIDPFALYDAGWEAMLRSRLERLDVEQLRDVIHQYRLDPKGQTEREKDAEKLQDWIVRAVEDIGSAIM